MSTLLLPPSSRAPFLFLPLLRPVARKWHILALLLALAGGVFGVFGAAYNEALHAMFLAAYIGAPMIEESLKPSGLYLMLAKWPRVLRNQLYTAGLAALAGVTFAIIENLVYLNIYIDEPNPQVILWRWTACLSMHALGSFIFGLGINRNLIASVRGERKFLSCGKRFFFSAMALHSAFNIAATVMAIHWQWLE
jgi:RsiW-degrading membrane proteinase PrsW (M82 family)